jgi:outer membrane protein TolC
MDKKLLIGLSLIFLSTFASANVADRNTTVNLSLKDLIKKVLQRNNEVVKQFNEIKISEQQVNYEGGIYDPILSASYNKTSTHIPNSTENELVRYQQEYWDKINSFDIGIGGVIQSGANWNLKFANNAKRSSLIEQYKSYDTEYDSSVKLQLEQPLLKGFGQNIVEAKLNLAKIEKETSQTTYEQKMMELQGLVIQLYWKWYGADKIYQSWEKSIESAEKSLVELKSRAEFGKIAQTEVLEAISSINLRKSEYENAKNKVFEIRNQILTLLNLNSSDYQNINFKIIDDPNDDKLQLLDLETYSKMALENLPEYKVLKKSLEKELLQIKYAQNQKLPQLNLVSSAETHSLEENSRASIDESFGKDFVSWSLGLRFSMPLFNNQADSSLNIAKLRLKQIYHDKQSMERNIINSLSTKIDTVESSAKQYALYKDGLELKKQLLDIEYEKLYSGKTSARILFDKEEDYMNYQRKFLNSLINQKVSEALLLMSTGNLFARYDINLNEFNFDKINSQSNLEIFSNKQNNIEWNK